MHLFGIVFQSCRIHAVRWVWMEIVGQTRHRSKVDMQVDLFNYALKKIAHLQSHLLDVYSAGLRDESARANHHEQLLGVRQRIIDQAHREKQRLFEQIQCLQTELQNKQELIDTLQVPVVEIPSQLEKYVTAPLC